MATAPPRVRDGFAPGAPAGAGAVLVRDAGAARRIAIDRPAADGALTPELLAALRDAVLAAGREAGVHAVVVHGTGACFSAGLDPGTLRELAEYPARTRELAALLADAGHALERLPQPAVAELHGSCAGAGVELALACDLRVMADDATLALPSARTGLIPAGGTAARLCALVGLGRAKELILTGRPIGAAAALAAGLVTRVAPRAQLRAATDALLQELAGCAPLALAHAKRVLDAAAKPGAAAALEHEAAALELCAQSIDFAAAATAGHGRPPAFFGC